LTQQQGKNANPVKQVIILEEDIHISIDFFHYFESMTPILRNDPMLYESSALNDNGNRTMVSDPTRILRSDFFPRLGWMMLSKLWNQELKTKWPTGYWDDWLCDPQQRMNRHVIHPESSRTYHLYHFGIKGGSSNNQFGNSRQQIQLSTININWTDAIHMRDYELNSYNQHYYSSIQSSYQVSTMRSNMRVDIIKTEITMQSTRMKQILYVMSVLNISHFNCFEVMYDRYSHIR
jgi:alpha-1,3-mannosyl-glycoprotein beta-1,2-N-acetylglucosaminyltransferase